MNHPSSELLAAFAEGRLQSEDLAAVSEHLRECLECRQLLGDTVRFLREAKTNRGLPHRSVWLAAAAAVIVAVTAGTVWFVQHRKPIDSLIAAMPGDARFIEPRLTGFPPAPLASANRGPEENDPRRMQLIGAAGRVLQKTAGDSSPDAVHAAGVAHLLTGQTQMAISQLRAAAEASHDSAVWNDLAAARFTAGTAQDPRDPEQLKYALAAADEALRIDPSMREALFNRALILTEIGLRDEAIAAWTRYLQIDPTGRFAEEARGHLQKVQAGSVEFPGVIERRMSRLASGDRAAALELIDIDAGEVRTFFETEIPARWGEAILRGDSSSAATQLNAARNVGAAMIESNGEPVVAEIVAAIDRADEATRRTLAHAHVTYRDGKYAYRPMRKPRESERLLNIAAAEFHGRSPMELLALTYAGVAVLGQNRIEEAQQRFRELSTAIPARDKSLSAYVQWQIATCLMAKAAWTESIDHLLAAIEAFEASRERSNAAYVHDIVSQVFGLIGDRRSSWQHRVLALRILGMHSDHRLEHAISGMVFDSLSRKEWREAMSLLHIEVGIAGKVKDDELLAHLFLRHALVSSRLGDDRSATSDLKEARKIVSAVEDPALRERLDIEVRSTTALTDSRPQAAVQLLSDALRFHDQSGWRVLMPDLYLRRGRMFRELGQAANAEADFEAGIAELERERETVRPGQQRWGVFDASEELFDEAIDLALETRQPARAFEYAERESDSPGTFQPGAIPADTAIIRFVALPETLIALTVDRRGFSAARLRIRRDELVDRIDQFSARLRSGVLDDGGLGELLVPQSTANRLVFLPDSYTALIPFAALKTSGRYVIERHAITVARSARAYLHARANENVAPRKTALIIDDPAAGTEAGLAFARTEADAIQSQYALAERLSGRAATARAFQERAPAAEVIHFAGHAIFSGDSAALLLAQDDPRPRSVDAAAISRMSLSKTSVVVLAACSSAQGRSHLATGAASVGYAFLQAGVPAVIATLWPIDDRQSADFFPRLHRHLARGESAPEALRETQLECIQDRQCNAAALWAAVEELGS
jgi:tetratricopeptide (TPR) repeat protein